MSSARITTFQLSVELATLQQVFGGASSGRFYAVACGLRPSVYRSWEECEPLVVGVKGALHKSFSTREKAEEFIQQKGL